jgi:crossover junction endodeoxyribonuclease RuvC
MTIVGIDPGWSGGIASVSPGTTTAEKFTGRTERDILDTLNDYLMFADVCYMEKVHSMPGQGVASMFKFGHIYGFLRAVVMAHDIPLKEVSPLEWQTRMRCRTKGDKNVSKARAQQLFPGISITHATADALLIASYGAAMEGR